MRYAWVSGLRRPNYTARPRRLIWVVDCLYMPEDIIASVVVHISIMTENAVHQNTHAMNYTTKIRLAMPRRNKA